MKCVFNLRKRIILLDNDEKCALQLSIAFDFLVVIVLIVAVGTQHYEEGNYKH